MNKNAIPLWRGQGEERYKTKDKTIEYAIDKVVLPLSPPEGDKFRGNANESSKTSQLNDVEIGMTKVVSSHP